MSLVTISFKNITEQFAQLHLRPCQKQELPNGWRECPQCGKESSPICSYERSIHYLAEDVTYIVHYYYCYQCRGSYTPLLPATLPNIPVGLDVLCHEAYLHTFKGHSYEDISQHLWECHGLSRCATSIRHDIERVAVFTENSNQWFRTLLEAYYTEHSPKVGLLDECFLDSFFSKKLCLSGILEPASTFLLGMSISRTRTKDVTRSLLEDLKVTFGEFDVFITDLAAQYPGLVKKVFEQGVIQHCVFHFFRLLFREILQPLTQNIKNQLATHTRDLETQLAHLARRVRTTHQGKFAVIWRRFLERFRWCLKRKAPLKLFFELRAFLDETQKSLDSISRGGGTLQGRIFQKAVRECLCLGQKWLSQVMSTTDLLNLQEALKVICTVRDLFRNPNPATFHDQLMTIGDQCATSDSPPLQAIGTYLKKYRETLGQFVQWGIHKSTSLLEKFFGTFKQNTKNGKGARTVTGYQTFADLFQLIWNTTAVRRRGEKKVEAASPVQRLWQTLTQKPLDHPFEPDGTWYEWIPSLPVPEYRRRRKTRQQARREEFQKIKESRRNHVHPSPSPVDLEHRASKRWRESDTLRMMKESLEGIYDGKKVEKEKKWNFPALAPKEIALLGVLGEHPQGLTRNALNDKLKLPRTTIYDMIGRLKLRQMVTDRKVLTGRRGRPKTIYLVCPYDPG